jgi:hypothetical protein
MTLLVRLSCSHNCRPPRGPQLGVSRPQNGGWRSDRLPRWLDHLRNRGWLSNCHLGRSDRLALRSTFVTCFANFGHALCGAHDFSHAPRGTYDSGRIPRDAYDSDRATRGPSIHDFGRALHTVVVPTLPTAILAPPSGCAGATDVASTSAFPTDEGRTGGASRQPSSDDHAGKAGLSATSRQTHPIGHFNIGLVTGAHLGLLCPCQSELASRNGRIICCLEHQQHLGSCLVPCWLQRCHRQKDFQE